MVVSISVGSVALGDPPITPPVDPSVIPVVPVEFTSPQPAVSALHRGALNEVNGKIRLYIKAAHHWEVLMGLKPTHSSYRADSTQGIAYANWVLKLWKGRASHRHVQAKRWMSGRIVSLLESVRQWRSSMGARSPSRQLSASSNLEARFNQARQVAQQVYGQYSNPPQMENFECIHGYEGSWTDQDSGHNGHYGGVQMGKAEWDKFGRPYTHVEYPYQASKLDQLWAAYRYWLVSGFRPWPQTARDCGLL